MTQKQWLERAHTAHGERYDYSAIIYEAWDKRVRIRCSIHGLFDQLANDHIRKSGAHGCSDCAHDLMRTSQKEFVEQAIAVHGNRYGYHFAIYKDSKIPVRITCFQHGSFDQSPNSHLRGHGCSACVNLARLDTDEFIWRSRKLYGDRYDYERTKYDTIQSLITITCRVHGDFTILTSYHLYGNGGCLRCVSCGSVLERRWLDYLGVGFEHRNRRFRINGKMYQLDAFEESVGIIYEFYGDYWHSNPRRFPELEEHAVRGITHGEVYAESVRKEMEKEVGGYLVVSIWEMDFNRIEADIERLGIQDPSIISAMFWKASLPASPIRPTSIITIGDYAD